MSLCEFLLVLSCKRVLFHLCDDMYLGWWRCWAPGWSQWKQWWVNPQRGQEWSQCHHLLIKKKEQHRHINTKTWNHLLRQGRIAKSMNAHFLRQWFKATIRCKTIEKTLQRSRRGYIVLICPLKQLFYWPGSMGGGSGTQLGGAIGGDTGSWWSLDDGPDSWRPRPAALRDLRIISLSRSLVTAQK